MNLFIYFTYFLNEGHGERESMQNRASFDSGVDTLMVVDSRVPTILGTRIRFKHRVPESGRFPNFDLPYYIPGREF